MMFEVWILLTILDGMTLYFTTCCITLLYILLYFFLFHEFMIQYHEVAIPGLMYTSYVHQSFATGDPHADESAGIWGYASASENWNENSFNSSSLGTRDLTKRGWSLTLMDTLYLSLRIQEDECTVQRLYAQTTRRVLFMQADNTTIYQLISDMEQLKISTSWKQLQL